jgi:hypothetical protein
MTIQDRLDREKEEEMSLRLKNLVFDPAEFLTLFPKPVEQFYDETTVLSAAYREHTLKQLHNDFPTLKCAAFPSLLLKHNSRYAPTYHEVTALYTAELLSKP